MFDAFSQNMLNELENDGYDAATTRLIAAEAETRSKPAP